MIKFRLVKEILTEYGIDLSVKDCDCDVEIYYEDYENVVLEFDSSRKNEVISIFIPNSIINIYNPYFSDPGVYLDENDGTLTVDNLKKYLEIIKNPVKHELNLLRKYEEMMSWVDEELWPVLEFYGYKYEHSSLLNPEKDDELWPGISFTREDYYSLYVGIDKITGELTGSNFLKKFDLLGKLQYELFLIFNEIKNDESSEYYRYFDDRVKV